LLGVNFNWEWVDTDQVLATTSVVTVILVAIAGGIAWAQLRHASRQRAEEQRPFVVVDVFGSRASIFRIEVKNIGKTIAREVKINFDPPLTSSLDKPNEKIQNIPMLVHGLPSLAPAKRHTFLFDSARSRKRTEYPDTYQVTVTYVGYDGNPYEDYQVLDLSPYWQTPDLVERDIHDVWTSLETMNKSLHGIHSALINLTPKPEGPFPPLPRGADFPKVIEGRPRSIEGGGFPLDPAPAPDDEVNPDDQG
jgi:hypothetical protein